MYPPILSLEKVSYQYSDKTIALKDITLNIELGKKVALLGNNGAGKSTLFLLLNAVIKASDGAIKFQGEPFSYKRKEIRKLRQHVGIVFQNPDIQLFSPSVYEDIRFGPKNMGLSLEMVEEAAKQAMLLTETEALKDKPPHFLSIGQKKRVAIAGILAMNPTLMVLDEPTAGLDPYYAKKMMQLLDDVHSQERSILLSTHDVNLAYEWADEVIILNEGRIVCQGDPFHAFQDEEINQLSHLEKPWILEVFDQLQQKNDRMAGHYPKTKKDLFDLLKKL
ncbi:ATP-binding cassette domain-containing protein [Bacillus sp. V3B]|uniref:energy-coupling factor ABC transporter ATP-binding protein n=1 Tax=Bacillus sp. V3B TaxID=2804915 RepID=UPI00210DF2C6|nr:ATP-binding cassette domain-containing protein [Bacillus sp. V3B]MCQ6274255.1 ATP-binding cassette domain-containing protein [Bacillus sp. V3B]